METLQNNAFRDPQLAALERELAALERELNEVPVGELKTVTLLLMRWIAKTRVYVEKHYPSHLNSFESSAEEPAWVDISTYISPTDMLSVSALGRQNAEASQARIKNMTMTHQWINRLRGSLRGLDQYAAPNLPPREKDQKFGILDAPNLLLKDLNNPAGLLGRAVIYFDLDGFKALNSKYTETIVDRDLLLKLHRLVSAASTNVGNAYREGGDEMTVLLPNATLGMGAAFAEALRTLIAQQEFLINQEKVKLTASLGVANDDQETPQKDLKGLANAAMKEAKVNGKNRVYMAVGESLVLYTDPLGVTLGHHPKRG